MSGARMILAVGYSYFNGYGERCNIVSTDGQDTFVDQRGKIYDKYGTYRLLPTSPEDKLHIRRPDGPMNLNLQVGHSYLNGEGRICTIKETRRSGEMGAALIYVDNLGETYFSTGVCTQATSDLEAKAHLRAKYSRACMLCGGIDAPQDEHGVCSHCNQPPQKARTERFGTNVEQIPVEALEAIGRQFAEGVDKYGYDNWKDGEGDEDYQRERLRHAILHLQRYANGDHTEEHLAKVGWYVVVQLYFEARK